MKPLTGLRVIDVTTNISGPTLTMILADLGAEVIKIEKPQGDEARNMEPRLQEDGVYFLNINRQKKSVVLNLKNEAEREQLYDIIKTADIFVENYRAGVTTKIGIDYDSLKRRNPQLLYCSLTAYGQHGPKKNYPGYDAIMQAETGIMSVTGDATLARVPVSLIDQGSAMWGVIGILSALLQRQSTGEGQFIATSLYETGIFWANYHLLATQLTNQNPQKLGSNHGAFAPYGAFQTADGAVMIGISNDALFEKLCSVLQQQHWCTDLRFSTNTARVQNRDVLNDSIEQLTLRWSCDALVAALEQSGVPVAKVKTIQDVLQDRQQQDNQMIHALPHQRDGHMYVTRLPLTFSQFDITPTVAAPLLGEHTAQFVRGEQYDV